VGALLKAKRQLNPLLPPSVQPHVRFLQIDRGTLTLLVDHPAWRTQLQPLEGMFRQVLGLPELRFRYRVARLGQTGSSQNAQSGPAPASLHHRSYRDASEPVEVKIARWKTLLASIPRGKKS